MVEQHEKTRDQQKLLGFIVWETWMLVQNLGPVHIVGVKSEDHKIVIQTLGIMNVWTKISQQSTQ